MPSSRIHQIISKMLFGEYGTDIHKYMDEPVKWMGRNHRTMRHDVATVATLYFMKGKKAAAHAAAHIVADRTLSEAYNQISKKIRKLTNDLFQI